MWGEGAGNGVGRVGLFGREAMKAMTAKTQTLPREMHAQSAGAQI